jgi:hypothetical protein
VLKKLPDAIVATFVGTRAAESREPGGDAAVFEARAGYSLFVQSSDVMHPLATERLRPPNCAASRGRS